jgi:hypothetical protein
VRWAFKEWAIIVDALGRGEQILILRKGGLREGRDGFTVHQIEFWLFPTLFHQQSAAVLPPAQKRFDEIAAELPSAPFVWLQFFARVADWHRLQSLRAAQQLKGQHIWRDEIIAERFDWGREKQIHALALRVFQLPKPVELPMRPEYGGCKTWIELERALSTEGAQPVLGDEAFSKKLARFRSAIDGAA